MPRVKRGRQVVGRFADGLQGIVAHLAERPVRVEVGRTSPLGIGQQVCNRGVDVSKASARNTDHDSKDADGGLFDLRTQNGVKARARA